MYVLTRSIPGRALALALAVLLATLGCVPGDTLGASPGVPEYQQPGLVPVPGGTVNAAGGNLMVERVDLSLDTVMGTWPLRAVYNSASGRWRWGFQSSYDGATFTDPTGAVYEVSGLPNGGPIPGTTWVRSDGDTIETRGGLGYHFDAAGRLSYVAWRSGAYPRIEYTWTSGGVTLLACTQAPACLPFYTLELDAEGDPLTATDARTGRRAEFSYDGLGRLVTARTPLDVAEGWSGTRYEYATATTLLGSITSSEGERIEYAWQTGRRIREVLQVGEGNPRHRFRFLARDGDGLYPTVHTNPLGGETRYRFDAQRRLRDAVLDDTGETFTYAWSGLRMASATLPTGVTTGFEFVQDDLATLSLPSGNVVTIEYEPGAVNFGDPSRRAIRRVTDSLGTVEERSYDTNGRLLSVTDGTGEVTSQTYLLGQTLASQTRGGVTQTFSVYGVHGHWLDSGGAAEDQRSFDPIGNERIPRSLLRGGGILSRDYDANRELSGLALAGTDQGVVVSQASLSIDRRSDGRMTAVSRPGGGDHAFTYDSLGRILEQRERVDGVWQVTLHEYDAAGNLTARTRPNGMREEFDHDVYGRRTGHRILRDGVLEGEGLLVYANGVPVSFYDSIRGGFEVYAYDAAGRRSDVTFAYGESLHRDYDLRSRLTKETFSAPGIGEIRVIEYGFDLADRPTTLTVDGEESIRRIYEDGRIARIEYGNGLTREFDYEPQTGLLTAAQTTDALGAVVETSTIARTLEFAPIRDQLTTTTATAIASTQEQYWIGVGGSLGNPDQAVGKRVFGWSGGSGGTESFVYDPLSNLVGDADGDTFTYNAEGNRLLAATLAETGIPIDYSYDEAGFVTSRGGVPITWTAAGRLASYGEVSVEWDMLGRPLSFTVGSVERDVALFGGRVERDPDSGALLATDLGEVSAGFGPERRYRHLDVRANVSFVSDESGAVVSHYRYAPYGVDAVFGIDEGGVSFVGRPEIGDLMLLGARVYDPAVARFLSPDPVFQVVNQYAYTLGNPVWFTDPDGTDSGPGGVEVGAEFIKAAVATVFLFATGATAGPAVAVALAITFSVQWFLVAYLFAQWVNGAGFAEFDPHSGLPLSATSAGAQVASQLAAPGGCAPTQLTRLPDARWLLYWLIPLQVVLGWAVLRRRRNPDGGTGYA